jgi:hypothetical protein
MTVADKDEAMQFVAEHHRRARRGEPSLASAPDSPPAERIVKVLFYDQHPNDWNVSDSLTLDELASALPELSEAVADDNGIVSVGHLASEVRNLSHPMVPSDPHESNFKMEEISGMTVESSAIDKAADKLEAA